MAGEGQERTNRYYDEDGEPKKVRSYRFADVLNEELDAVADGKPRDPEDDPEDPKEKLKEANERAHRSRLLGLAFSGGGIRSATFNLGVLQALAEMKLLNLVHYLSTVSGGGYIGAWLKAWQSRTKISKADEAKKLKTPIAKLEAALNTHRDTCAGDPPEAKQVRFLRKYSNYLTPKMGWFGADTWTAIAVYLRNLILNIVLLTATFCALLLIPHLARALVIVLPAESPWIGGMAVFVLVASYLFTVMNVSFRGESKPWYTKQGAIQIMIILPIFAAGWLGSSAFKTIPVMAEWSDFFVWGGIGGGCIFVMMEVLKSTGRVQDEWVRQWWSAGRWAAVISGFIAGTALYGIRLLLECDFMGVNELVAFCPPLFVSVVVLNNIFFVGLMSRSLPTELREWWARLNAWFLIYSLVWMGVFCVAFYLPDMLLDLGEAIGKLKFAAIGGWAVTTAGGLLAARGSNAASDDQPGLARRLLTAVAPYVFIVGIFVTLALSIDLLLVDLAEEPTRLEEWWERFRILAAVFGIIVFLFSYKLDINQFSMHMFYRNRLTRSYLGASNMDRRAHPFTGFDRSDDIDLHRLDGEDADVRPYPIINTTLNLVAGSELAWQTRKAASFAMTPKFCGYDISADAPSQGETFCRTSEYAQEPYRLSLGTGVAISGAAASSNMGYHTSPAVAFLMTVFNVRLGWWIGNTAHVDGRKRSSPRNALMHLVAEMFGLTKRTGPYIYLSDGGHFENLGIYELVRRRCRYIIACDAEQDGKFEFTGLGNAVEKCRADLGIDIDIRVDPIKHRDPGTGWSDWHCAIGSIDYGTEHPPGILVYIKASLTGDEPTDVLRYATKNPNFPHQSTGDQWFDESQFESYRALGHHIARDVFGGIRLEDVKGNGSSRREKLFVALQERWWPPSMVNAEMFTRHTRSLAQIYRTLRSEKNLGYLSAQIYPEWKTFLGVVAPGPEANADSVARRRGAAETESGLPSTPEEARAGFYVCNSVIQLMEDVYLDLQLEKEHEHPDNRGWINMFKHWSWSGMFRLTWTICASTYGARFQKFCEEKLDLRLGNVRTDEKVDLTKTRWNRSAGGKQLNWHERELIRTFIEERGKEGGKQCAVHLLQIHPEEGVPREHHENLRITFGFAVIRTKGARQKKEIVYFRIQDHLRRMGLARKAIASLIAKGHASGVGEPPSERFGTAKQIARFRQMYDSVELEGVAEEAEA